MKFSRFNLFLVCSPLMGFALTALHAAPPAPAPTTFSWTQAAGPPQQLTASCGALPSCVPATNCVAVSPPVSLVPNGGTNSVWVVSYQKLVDYTYGNCTGTVGTCYAYPNVQCANLSIYGLANCQSSWGTAYVYAGSCTP